MKNSRALLLQAGLTPKLRLAVKKQGGGVISTGSHRVKLLEDKIIKGQDKDTGKEIEYVRYVVEENGEKKHYDTKLKNKQGELSYFVQRMADVAEDDEVVLTCKRAGMKNYIEVLPVSGGTRAEVDEEDIETLNEE